MTLFPHRRGIRLLTALLAAAGTALSPRVGRAAPGSFVWIESEALAAKRPTTLTVGTNGWGQSEVLSGGAWLSLTVPAADVDKGFPGDDGPTFDYSVVMPSAGTYAVWNRIGFERVRSPIEWRIDSGPWTPVAADAPTVDQADLQDWVPMGWLNMGTQTLSAGKHTLQIHVLKSTDDKGKRADLHYASDALLLTDSPFHPNGALKPDQPDGITDADHAATTHVFTIPAPPSAAQATNPLAGMWQITADDESVVDDRLGPIKAQPDFSSYLWRSIAIPSDRNVSRPEMRYVHRYWLRTRISVPAQAAGRACFLHFPAVNMAATVFVNGHACGFTKNNFAPFDCDITSAVRPGEINEVAVGIKDSFYGSADPAWARQIGYLPFSFWHYNAGMQLDMPVLYHFENGLLRTPTLVLAGPAYTADVFAIPSVKNKTLGLEITLHNPTAQSITVSLENAVTPLSGGPVEKTFASRQVAVPALSDTVARLSEPWPNPKLWWPDDPRQYIVTTRLILDGKTLDERQTKFGFREWGWSSASFTLNGIPWHGFEDVTNLGSGATFLANYRAHHQTMHRMWGEPADLEEQLDFMDASGVNVRRTGIFDGEGASGFYDVTRKPLWKNYRGQLGAWIKGQRNHPSIFIWSIENEITFINGHVTGHDAVTTAEHHASGDVVRAADPTRPWMVDGGNALLDESFPVYGGHYLDPPFTSLPAGAYDRAGFAHRQTWPITRDKPILLGETYYAAGNDLADFATVYGDTVFVGKSEAKPAIGRIARMLSEGYRWNGINFDLYMSSDASTREYYDSWKPLAVICKDWDWTFGSGQTAPRALGIFNDTRSAEPITMTTALTVAGKVVSTQSSVHHIAPGANEKLTLSLSLPTVTARRDGQWALTLIVGGKPVFTRTQPISVLPPPTVGAGGATIRTAALRGGQERASVAVYDPVGAVATYLRARHVPVLAVASLARIPASAKVLLVGKDALTPAQSASSALAAFASGGHVVIVLEQTNPLRYQGLPGQMATTSDEGNIAFMETQDSPLFEGLKQEDFLTWTGSGPLYRDAYAKPTASGQSLIQCGQGLQDTALAGMPTGTGMLLLSQLTIEGHLSASAVARKLLINLVRFGLAYHPTVRAVSVVAAANTPLLHAVTASGLLFQTASDPGAALQKPGTIAVLSAEPATLHRLAADRRGVDSFTKAGGWIVLNGLTPDGLADYNRLVGFDHMIRPYGQEKVAFPRQRSALTAGLSASNIVLGSGRRIFDFAAGEYPDPNGFSYIVDIDEVAPFGKSTFASYDKITNNYTMADGFWPLIINFPVSRDGSPTRIPITLPKPQTLTRFTYVQDLNYAATKKVSLIFGGSDRVSFSLPPNGEPQTFDITPPRTTDQVTLEIDDWDHDPAKQQNGQDLVGVDNLYLFAKRPAGFADRVQPLTNIGALVAYPRGAGGIILCNVKFNDTESVPANATKKQAILATLLRNLHAPFSGKSIVAGAENLTYTPVDLSTKANQFKNEQGWFGDSRRTFADLPGGRQTFAGVPYNLYSFTTSPVPTVVMLGGKGVPGSLPDQVTGIPVNRKADALFFLQAARIDQPPTRDDLKASRRFEMADYVIHYADGTTVKAPIYAGESVDNYVQDTPLALPGAQTAWTRPYADGKSAVAYSMQWNNPHPEKTIESIEFAYGPDRRGVPVLLALTAATAH